MTNRMKWALIGIGGFFAVGVVASLLVLAANTENHLADEDNGLSSPEPQENHATTTPPAEDRLSDAPLSTTTTSLATTTTSRPPTLTELEETFEPRHKRFFTDMDLTALAEFPELKDPEFETKMKLRTTLLAAGYVFAALEPGSEGRQVYRDSLASADPDVAAHIEEASQHLDPRWASGVISNCFRNDPAMYLIMSEVIEPDVDVVGDETGFDSYQEVIDNCVWFTVYHNYNDTVIPMIVDS